MKGVLTVTCVVLFWAASGQAQAPFYQGKTISIIVGTKAGDTYDLYARLLAQHLPKHIPGRPNIIIQNMPGAGAMIAANHIYNVAKPDGLSIGAIYPALYFDQVIGRREVRFDWSKFIWMGSPVTSNNLIYIRADSPYKSMADIVKATEPPKCGANATSSIGFYLPKLLEELIGAKFNIVMGYQAGADIDLAVERGEVACRAFTITSFFAREPFHTWRKKNFVRVLIQTGRKGDSRLSNVPTIYALMNQYKTPEAGKRLATLILAAGDFGRPYVLSPNTPRDRVAILRNAFAKTISDKGFLSDADKRNLEIDFSSAEELETLAKEVVKQTPEVVQNMRNLLGM